MALGFIPQECPQARTRSRRIRSLLAASDGPADSSPRANKGWYFRHAPSYALRDTGSAAHQVGFQDSALWRRLSGPLSRRPTSNPESIAQGPCERNVGGGPGKVALRESLGVSQRARLGRKERILWLKS